MGACLAIVQLPFDVPAEAVARVRHLLTQKTLRDPAWRGTVFRIVRGAGVIVTCPAAAPSFSLLEAVHRALEGEPTGVVIDFAAERARRRPDAR